MRRLVTAANPTAARITAARITASVVACAALVSSCSPDLGETPFACSDGKNCPSGYACVATVCVEDGQSPKTARPMRVTYINSAEMYWFASPAGGATLVVNDGFSPGARGIYEIHVDASGKVGDATELLPFANEMATSTAIVALDDEHYGVVTMGFPGALEDGISIALHSLPREGAAAAGDTVLYQEKRAYLGGYEPAYIAGVENDGEVVFAFTDQSAGGSVVITRVSNSGVLVDSFQLDLPEGILPLSGDCLLWKGPDDRLMLRLGLDAVTVFSIDLEGRKAVAVPSGKGTPLFGYGGSIAWLETRDDGSAADYVVRDLAGAELGRSPSEAFASGLEPYTGTSFQGGALVAPLSSDDAFSTIEVGYLGASGSFANVASVTRPGSDALYSARAFASDGKAYVAWTSFHDSLMDLWVAATPLGAVP